jgi:Holliday junction resolvase RusA-like endonuclease
VTVLGAPVAQPRQRHRHVHTKAGAQFDMNYTPTKHPVQQFKADIKDAVTRAGLPPALLQGPIALECRFYLPRPNRLMRRADPAGPVLHTSKPDLDNLIKSTMDSLREVVWRDDSQVVIYRDTGKFYAEKEGRPRLEMTIYDLTEA